MTALPSRKDIFSGGSVVVVSLMRSTRISHIIQRNDRCASYKFDMRARDMSAVRNLRNACSLGLRDIARALHRGKLHISG